MKKGFSLVETIIAIGILLVVIVGITGVLQLSIKVAGRSGARVGATSLVNKRMEMLRNLIYDDVGTVGGIPQGNIPPEENVVLNNIDYVLKTFIQYIDDSADGTDDDDENGITADYKRARIEVSWSGKYAAAPVVAVSDFMPKGIETIVGGGTLSISVFDAQIQPVSLANVRIVNNDINPSIDINVQTSAQGKIVFPGSPSIGKYEITVTKSGYSTAQTYNATPENPNPDPGHLTILEGETTEASFAIDRVSSLAVYTLASNSFPIDFVSFEMTGTKVIGTDSGGDPIYKYSETQTTGLNGYLNILNLEWDIYDISSPRITQDYDISASSPPEPINITPNISNALTFYLVPHTDNTLLVIVEDAAGGILGSASVRLFKAGYDKTILSGSTGQSFFTPLQPAVDYSLEVTRTGYQDNLLENVEVDGQGQIIVILSTP